VSCTQKNPDSVRSETRTYGRRTAPGRHVVITETTITYETDAGRDEPDAPDLHLLVMSPQVLFSKALPASGIVTIGRSSRCEAQLEDPMSSREHARIHVVQRHGSSSLLVEDVGSANGTLLRERLILRGHRIPIALGDAVTIGSTVLMVLQGRSPVAVRRIWSRGYFENRLAEECARAVGVNASLALTRIRFDRGTVWTAVLPIVAGCLPSPHVFAARGSRDYDALLVDLGSDEVSRMMGDLVKACARSGLATQVAVAYYPEDGRSPDALLARLDEMTSSA
jgi:pSer/pThr/pTyr-binding forkhead associated (FHA) protein